jgi:hypothetical protein
VRIGERRRGEVGEPEGKRLQYMREFFQNFTGLLIYKNTQWKYRIFSLIARVQLGGSPQMALILNK